MISDREKLDTLFNSIAKRAEKDKYSSVFRGDDIRINSFVPFGVLSQIPTLDLALARPGYPTGRVLEFFGKQASGKTTAALHALAQIQSMGGAGLFVDTEQSYDEKRFREIGIDIDGLSVISAGSIESIFRSIEYCLKSLSEVNYNKPFIIIIDSLTAVSTEYALEKDLSKEARIGQDARKIKEGFRRIIFEMSRQKVLLIAVNHAYHTMQAYGKQLDSGGGLALKFYAWLRLIFKDKGKIKKTKGLTSINIGQKVGIQIDKWKGGSIPNPNLEIPLIYDRGFNTEESLLDASCEAGLVEKVNQMTYKFNEESFKRSDWVEILQENGGLQVMYSNFINYCIEHGHMLPWGKV